MVRTVSYMPTSQTYWSDHHESRPTDPSALLGSVKITPGKNGPDGELVERAKYNTTLYARNEARIASLIAANQQKILTSQLTAADFEANRANLDHLILIRLHNQLMGEQMRWFHLDAMFNSITLDKLLYRMTFKDNPAAAQKVGRRDTYDTAKVAYDEINFSLEKIVVSWDMPIEDPLRALISPILPLEQTNDYSMAYYREREALAALQQLKYKYKKGENTHAKRFTTTTEPNDDQKLSNPSKLTAGNVHSDKKFVNEVQVARNLFMQGNDVMLTHFACSPKTAMDIAQNTWTENNTIFNVEAYRTNGGVRNFPGLSNATMVISQVVPDNILYSICKPMNVLVKAEGPKITKTWEDNPRWTTQTATADFHQYKCAHEDLTMKRTFGVIFEIDDSE